MKYLRIAIILLLFSSVLVLQAQDNTIPAGFTPAQNYHVEVLNTYPHDTSAFTEGLIWYNGSLYESTGEYDQSNLREVDLTTGEVKREVMLNEPLPPQDGDTNSEPQYAKTYFGEGITLVGDSLIQLTWQSNTAFVYDINTFERTGTTFQYENEGWGLCYDGHYLYQTDSTQYIAVREPDTFDLIARILVSYNGQPVQSQRLNELECVGDSLYANWWMSDAILKIDKFTGNVTALIDARDLLTDDMKLEIPGASRNADTNTVTVPNDAVLNGIAYNPDTDTFYVTGKDWPRLFEVRFVPDA